MTDPKNEDTSNTGTRNEGAPGGEAAPTKTRKPVPPTFVWIGKKEDGKFTILAELQNSPSDAEVRVAVKALGFGTYGVLRGRMTTAVYEELKAEKLTL